MPLTDAACKNAKCHEGRAFRRRADSGGLYLEITRAGAKLWRWKYRYGGKEKRLALGSYPEVSQARARTDRDAARDDFYDKQKDVLKRLLCAWVPANDFMVN